MSIVFSVFTQYHPYAWVIKNHNNVTVQLYRFNGSHDWSSWHSSNERWMMKEYSLDNDETKYYYGLPWNDEDERFKLLKMNDQDYP